MSKHKLLVHVPYFGRGYAELIDQRNDEPFYKIHHECLSMSVYRVESQFTVLQAPGFHSAMIDGIVTRDPVESEKLMREHMAARNLLQDVRASVAAKPQYTAPTVQHGMLKRDMPRMDIHTLMMRYPDLAPKLLRLAMWRTIHNLKTIPALPAPKDKILILEQPERVTEEAELEEEQAA